MNDRRAFLSRAALGLLPAGMLLPAFGQAPDDSTYNVRAFGAKGDGITDDTQAIQAAAKAARDAGGGVVWYPAPRVEYRVTDRILIDSGRVTHRGTGWGTVIRQASWGRPAFEIRGADDVLLEGLRLLCRERREVIPGLYDGEPARDYSAGVYATATNRLRVHRVAIEGFVCGVNLRGGQRQALDNDNLVHDCLFTTVDWGVLAEQQRRLRLVALTGSPVLSQVGNPAHLIYFTGGMTKLYSEDCQVLSAVCYDNAGGSAFQFKFLKRLNATELTGHSCAGLISAEYLEDSVLTALLSSESTNADANTGEIYLMGPGVVRNVFSDVSINLATDTSAINVGSESADNLFSNLQITARMSKLSGVSGIYVRGMRNRFVNIRLLQIGAPKVGIWFNAGSGHQLEGLSTIGCSRPVEVGSGVTAAVIRYDPAMITPP